MCARAGGRGGRGGRGAAGPAPPGPPAGAACCRASSAARGPTWRPGNSRGGAWPLTLKGTREAGAGAQSRPSACPPVRLPHTKQSPERKSGPSGSHRWAPGAPCAPRTQHQPRAPTYLAKGAAAAPGESEANFGAASPALSSVPGSLPSSRSPGWATPTLLSTAPAPGPVGRTGLLPAAPGKGGRGGGASLHGLSPDAAAPGPGPAARTGPQGGSESAKCLVGARGGRRGRGGGCRGSARLGRRGAARAMLRMFGMRTGMK